MNDSLKKFIPEIKRLLTIIYGERLKGVILYGSEARGEAEEDSDIDFLVLLTGPVKFGEEARKIIHALYPVQLKVFRPIHAVPTDAQHFQQGGFAVFRNAQKDGVPV